MDLRRKISYQWQMFLPLVLTLWVVILGMGFLQFHNEAEFRSEKIREQLDLVNSRVIAAYEKDINPEDFLDFIAKYYRDNELYDKIRISLYVDGKLSKAYGRPITLTEEELAGNSAGSGANNSSGDFFYRKRSAVPTAVWWYAPYCPTTRPSTWPPHHRPASCI